MSWFSWVKLGFLFGFCRLNSRFYDFWVFCFLGFPGFSVFPEFDGFGVCWLSLVLVPFLM